MTHITIKREVLEQAIEALSTAKTYHANKLHEVYVRPKCIDAITTLRTAQEAPAAREPVPWQWTKTPSETGAYWFQIEGSTPDICWIHDGRVFFVIGPPTEIAKYASGGQFYGPLERPEFANLPHEYKTEAEKIAFAFGWWEAFELNRAATKADTKQGERMTYKINHEQSIATAEGYYLQDMSTCPVGVKVQLMNPGGVLTYGTWDGKNRTWQAWAPLPRRRKEND